MSLSFYRPREGFFSRTNPTARVLTAIALFVPPFLLGDDPAWQGVYFAALLAPAVAARALPNLWRLKGLAAAIFLVSTALWTATLPGRSILWHWGPLTITQEALLFALARATRLLSFLAVGAVFLTITSVEQFAYGLRRLGVPHRASFAATLAFRLAPLFLETTGHIADAQRARGLELDRGGPLTRARRFVPLLAPALVAGFRRADGLAVALEARGFALPDKPTEFLEYPISWRDALLLCVAISANIAAHFVGRWPLL
jgi:energy-coupling factor transport system permease protein